MASFLANIPTDRKHLLIYLAGFSGVLVLAYLIRQHQAAAGSGSATGGTGSNTDPGNTTSQSGLTPEEEDAYASQAGQEQSDVAGLSGQEASDVSALNTQEQGDVANLTTALAGEASQEQSDAGSLASALAGLASTPQALQTEVSTQTTAIKSLQATLKKLQTGEAKHKAPSKTKAKPPKAGKATQHVSTAINNHATKKTPVPKAPKRTVAHPVKRAPVRKRTHA